MCVMGRTTRCKWDACFCFSIRLVLITHRLQVDGKPFCPEHALDVDEDDGEYSGESGEDVSDDE